MKDMDKRLEEMRKAIGNDPELKRAINKLVENMTENLAEVEDKFKKVEAKRIEKELIKKEVGDKIKQTKIYKIARSCMTGIGAASTAAGLYHGFCDAQGMPFNQEHLEAILTYGPTAVQMSCISASSFYFARLGIEYQSEKEITDKKLVKKIKREMGLKGAGAGLAVGAFSGGLTTLLGYGLGYTAGKLMK